MIAGQLSVPGFSVLLMYLLIIIEIKKQKWGVRRSSGCYNYV